MNHAEIVPGSSLYWQPVNALVRVVRLEPSVKEHSWTFKPNRRGDEVAALILEPDHAHPRVVVDHAGEVHYADLGDLSAGPATP